MSALLTTTMPYMKVVVQALKDEGLRDGVFVMVGGAPVTESFARSVGADAYGRDAAVAVDLARAYMARRHAELRVMS
jgi:methanogenic corrinoid protein MtbC1